MTSAVEQLHQLCEAELFASEYDVVRFVLDDPKFAKAPAAQTHHHNYVGGLAQHTLEVADLAARFAAGFVQQRLALIAAIFHDYNKIYEHEVNLDGSISNTSYKKQTGHLIGSYESFRQVGGELLDSEDFEAISHAILAHHGRREWGSPVEPMTPLAFALHSADMLSMQGYVNQGEVAKETVATLPALVQVNGWKSDGALAG